MFDKLGGLIRSIPLGRFENEPVRVLYVVAIGLETFATLSLGHAPIQAVIQGVLIAAWGEVQRQRVSPAT
jgi:hypothetical protein